MILGFILFTRAKQRAALQRTILGAAAVTLGLITPIRETVGTPVEPLRQPICWNQSAALAELAELKIY